MENQSQQPVFMSKGQKEALQESQLRQKQEQQIAEVLGQADVETVPGNIDSKFKIRKEESENYVHVWTRVKHVDAGGKSFTNEDRVIMIHAKSFNSVVNGGAFITYDEIAVVHDPRKDRPKAYNLKPSQINIPGTGATTPGLANVKTSELQDRLEKENKRLDRMLDEAEKRLKAIEAKEKELAEKEAALSAKQPEAINTPDQAKTTAV